MIKYIAYLVLANERTAVEYETDKNPVEYLWERYGMDTYIESVEEVGEQTCPQYQKASLLLADQTMVYQAIYMWGG